MDIESQERGEFLNRPKGDARMAAQTHRELRRAAALRLSKLNGIRHIMQPVAARAATPEAFNAHLDSAIRSLESLRESVKEPEPKLALEATKDPEHKTPGRDRGTAGGHAREAKD